MDIKEKFTPETHQMRDGFAWRDLSITHHKYYQIVAAEIQGAIGMFEVVIIIDGSGSATTYDGGHRSPQYDLEPIQHDLIELPLGLRSELEWAAMDGNSHWYGYANAPELSTTCKWKWGLNDWRLDCHDIPQDPAGWENSLHRRINIDQDDERWERA